MGAEAALAQLKVAVKEAEADREIFLLNSSSSALIRAIS
jgi:hypothetical protein